nr:hypothetical protein [uncultured Blautia sp.]
MEQIQQQINLFHTLFYVCLGICIFCLILSIIFFFKFDIINIFNARTGRSVKKTVQHMEEINSRTGQLRRPAGRGNTGTLSRSGNIGNSKKLGSVRKAKMEDIIQPPTPTEPLAADATGVLGADATEVLDAGATEVLNQSMQTATKEMVQREVDESHGMFRIEKYELLIHTNEVV